MYEVVLDKIQFMQKAMSVEWKQCKEKNTKKKGVIFLASVIQLSFAYGGGRISAGMSCYKRINKATLIYSS